MCKLSAHPYRQTYTPRHSLLHALLTAGLCVSACVSPGPSAAWGYDPCDDIPAENSLLVARREARQEADDAPTPADSLEPIADVSELRPELAESSRDSGQLFGAALAKIAAENRGHGSLGETISGTLSAVVETDSEQLDAEAARFNGIQPGTSTYDDLLDNWGEPADALSTDDGQVLTFDIEPFESIEVLVTDDLVEAIKVELAEQIKPDALAQELSLDGFQAVTVLNEQGDAVGQVYPERGVMFLFASGDDGLLARRSRSPHVSHVAIQRLRAEFFALRAENNLHGPYQRNIQDLKFALSLDGSLAQAHWLLSEIYLSTGQADLAECTAERAYHLEPRNAAYQLRWAEALALMGSYDEAVQEVRAVLDRPETPPLVMAQALYQMGGLASLGEGSIALKAMDFYTKAIELADPVAASQNLKERHAAQELLIRAHLAVAVEIARQGFENKEPSVAEWISRASGLAEAAIEEDDASLELRLSVAQQALAALASYRSTVDPEPWITEARETADLLLEEHNDTLWKQRIQWELGIAYLHCVQIEHIQGKTDSALRYGQLAVENLAEGAKSRQAVFECEQLVGRLYFLVGAVYAVHNKDHQQAVKWYDRAAPLLTAPRPVSDLVVPRRDGEQLVSMGVSYWQVGERSQALEVTKYGVMLIKQAVDHDILDREALAVPYGNLASMYRQLGEPADAAKYAELADAVSPKKSVQTTPKPKYQPKPSVGGLFGQFPFNR